MNDIENLKKEVIEAFNYHELGYELKMTDQEYDAKLKQLKSLDPEFEVHHHLWSKPGATIEHRHTIGELEKYFVDDIIDYWNIEEGKVKLPKFDGSSIVINYNRSGEFSHIVTMSDKYAGFDQTDKFRKFVPKSINPLISYLRAEVVVDRNLHNNARGKANGLVNSKHVQDEVDRLTTIIAYTAYGWDGEALEYSVLSDPSSIQQVVTNEEESRILFMTSPQLDKWELTDKGFCKLLNTEFPLEVAIDGIVYAEDENWNNVWGYKYYYIESRQTTVTYNNWKRTDKEGRFAVLEVIPVELDGKTITNPSSNGTSNMYELGLGVGAVVEVVFSGTTIPKVINVIKPAKVENPVCSCGKELTYEDNLYGSVLMCTNHDCDEKYTLRKTWIENVFNNREEELQLTNKEYLDKYFDYYFFLLLNVSRLNYESSMASPITDD